MKKYGYLVCFFPGTANMDPRVNGKVSGYSMAFIMLTNLIPPFIAAALSFIINPGKDLYII